MTGQREIADVSVIMPAWRAGGTIGRALQSIADQTILPREVVIVDDGSDDDTCERAERMATALSPVELRIFRQANAGPGAARNRAIAESRGSLLAFLDADDEWLPEKLAVSLPALRDPETCLVAHNMIVERDGTETKVDCARHLPAGTDAFTALFVRGFVATATVVCRRDAIVARDGFDETLLSGQDYELWLAIARFDGRRIVLLPAYLTRYHVTADSVSSKIGLRRTCAIRIAQRHAPGLRDRARLAPLVLSKRLAVITAEAALGFAGQKTYGNALAACGGFPWLVASLVVPFVSRGGSENETETAR